MTERNLRVSVLSHLDSLPSNSSIHPSELARQLGLLAEQVNPFLDAAKQSGEIIVLPDGSVHLADHLRNQFPNGPSPTKVPTKERDGPRNISWPFFGVGILLLVVAAAFAIYGFVIGNLTRDQRGILMFWFALASGFAAGCFVGGMTISADGWVKGLFLSATGGFAVWVLCFFFAAEKLFPDSPDVPKKSDYDGLIPALRKLQETYVRYSQNPPKAKYEDYDDAELKVKQWMHNNELLCDAEILVLCNEFIKNIRGNTSGRNAAAMFWGNGGRPSEDDLAAFSKELDKRIEVIVDKVKRLQK